MHLQSIPKSFKVRCYACKHDVEITTRIWEVRAEDKFVDYWAACPHCAADLFACAEPRRITLAAANSTR